MHSRRGTGTAAALAIFRKFPGNWRVAQDIRNTQAQAFWRKVIDQFTDGYFSGGLVRTTTLWPHAIFHKHRRADRNTRLVKVSI